MFRLFLHVILPFFSFHNLSAAAAAKRKEEAAARKAAEPSADEKKGEYKL